MIKFIVYFIRITAIAIVTLLFASCGGTFFNGIKGNGIVQTEKRTPKEKFTKISVSRGIEVLVEQADVVSIEVEADGNLVKHITTQVENGTLMVSSDENIYSATAEKVHVKMPVVEGLEATSGSQLKTSGTLKSALNSTEIHLETTSGAEIEADLEYDVIYAESTSGSSMKLSGKTLKVRTASTSGAEIHAEDLLANEVTAEASSGSATEVHPILNFIAKANSGASIDYAGSPKNISKEESSGGSISSF
ncbi:head GIN domain-containing protein [Flavobacterium aciduliphilum]|uniref:Putative autotransporter adhesin-like protein n=1 Tax=Flavobacterium aciduliphilum TaxID=1101402 RepID=A0A328YPG1_9FLAO|nr:head GIN domain-containing protein [Flavobacterium aciduliphilum]RAR75480.1 putative autotransporter adhesin-like protein [Flavobacterium aciduliphilum]